jgi:hypothetical protein
VDINGCAPAHKRRFSEPPTGECDHDLAKSWHQRIFDDLSMPIVIDGRHWGAGQRMAGATPQPRAMGHRARRGGVAAVVQALRAVGPAAGLAAATRGSSGIRARAWRKAERGMHRCCPRPPAPRPPMALRPTAARRCATLSP